MIIIIIIMITIIMDEKHVDIAKMRMKYVLTTRQDRQQDYAFPELKHR